MVYTTVRVPHLGGIDVGYLMPQAYDSHKPTCILVNSMSTNANLYGDQFNNEELNKVVNLLAIEPLGHGKTSTKARQWTYWDTALMIIQTLDALGVKKAFALGTSQGGWIVTRLALIAPERIEGILTLGTSMDYESAHSRELGCWNGPKDIKPLIDHWTSTKDPNWVVEDAYCQTVSTVGFGAGCPESTTEYWTKAAKELYSGTEGREKLRMASICLLERDGLISRVNDITCPVLWIHGTDDAVFSVALAKEEIKLFANSVDAQLIILAGGAHYLSASKPKEVNEALISFVAKWK